MQARRIEGWRSRLDRELREGAASARELGMEPARVQKRSIWDSWKRASVEFSAVVLKASDARRKAFADLSLRRARARSFQGARRWTWSSDPELQRERRRLLQRERYARLSPEQIARRNDVSRAWIARNLDRVRAIKRQSARKIYLRDREKILARWVQLRFGDAGDALRAQKRAYYAEHREQLLAAKRQRRAANYSDEQRLRDSIYQQLLRLAGLAGGRAPSSDLVSRPKGLGSGAGAERRAGAKRPGLLSECGAAV